MLKAFPGMARAPRLPNIALTALALVAFVTQAVAGDRPLKPPRKYPGDAPLRETRATETENGEASIFPDSPIIRDIKDQFSLLMAARELLRNQYDIDQLIGDPWSLYPETEEAFKRVPPRARLAIHQFITRHRTDLYWVPERNTGQPPAAPAQTVVLDPRDSKEISKAVVGIFGGVLTPEQIADLAVFTLSQNPTFPKTQAEWDKVKNTIVANDLYIALAVIVGVLAFDGGNIGVSGLLYQSKGEELRIGWYGSLRHLGRSLEPNTRTGLHLDTPYADVAAGVHANLDDGRALSVEATLIEHWLERFVRPWNWKAQLTLDTAHTIYADDPRMHGNTLSSATLHATRPGLFPTKDLTFRARTEVNSNGKTRSEIAAMLDDPRDGWSAFVQAETDQDRNWKAGVFVGGEIGGGYRILMNDLRALAKRIGEGASEIARYEVQLGENLTSEQLAHWHRWLGVARLRLRRHILEYAIILQRYRLHRKARDPKLELFRPEELTALAEQACQDSFGMENSPLFGAETAIRNACQNLKLRMERNWR